MTKQFAISPDVNVRNIADWFIFNTKVQRMTGEGFHATVYTDFADLHRAYSQGEADLVYANAADTATLVRDRGYVPIAAAKGVSKEASVVVAKTSPYLNLSDLPASIRAASTDAPDVERICRILLEPANLGPGDIHLEHKPNPVLVAKAIVRNEVELGFFPKDAFAELSSIIQGQLRVLITSKIYVVKNSLLASPGTASLVEPIWAGLDAMSHDPNSAELLAGLGAPNGWQRIGLDATNFMIDLMDALSQG